MSAVLKPTDTVRAVAAAAADKSKAAAEVLRLQNRLYAIEARAQETLAERARHQRAVTTALLEDSAMPKALPPQPVEPDDALAIVKTELKNAQAALVIVTGDHRTAIVRHVERLRAEAVADYRAALQQFTERLRSLAAFDRILARTGLTNALPPLFRSRLSIPGLPGDDAPQGVVLDGGNFFGKPEQDAREREARAAIERDTGPLPF